MIDGPGAEWLWALCFSVTCGQGPRELSQQHCEVTLSLGLALTAHSRPSLLLYLAIVGQPFSALSLVLTSNPLTSKLTCPISQPFITLVLLVRWLV